MTINLWCPELCLVHCSYEPNTISPSDEREIKWWLALLEAQIPNVAAKAAQSAGNTEEAQRRAAAFAR
jgi:hypothetical protein